MKIAWTMACDSAQENPDGSWNLQGLPSDAGAADELPVQVELYMLIAVVVGPYDSDPSTLEITVLSPRLVDMGSIQQALKPPRRGPLQPEGDESYAFKAVKVTFVTDEVGTYTFSVALDDQAPVTWPFTIFLAS